MSDPDKVIPVRVAVRIRPLSKKEEDEGCVEDIRVRRRQKTAHLSLWS